MGAGLPLFCRTAIADFGLDGNEGRSLCFSLCSLDGQADGVRISSILNRNGLETESAHSLFHILAERNVCASLNGNLIGIVKNDQFPKDIGVVVHNRIIILIKYGGQMLFRQSHTDSHPHSGSQRACGCFHSNRVAIFWVTWSQGTNLPEIHNILFLQSISK